MEILYTFTEQKANKIGVLIENYTKRDLLSLIFMEKQ